MRLAVDLRPLLEPHESGVTLYTQALVREFLEDPRLELDLFYQARRPCARIHKLFPRVRHLLYSNTLFHLRSLWGFPPLPPHYFPRTPELIWIPDRRPFYKTPIPIVMTIHDRVPEFYKHTLSLKSRLWHFLFPLRRLLRLCKGILVPSFTVGGVLNFKGPKEVTYEGARLAHQGQMPSTFKPFLGRTFFLCISPWDPRKRLDWIFRAADLFPEVTFVVIGLKPNDQRFSKVPFRKCRNHCLIPHCSEEEKKWLLKHCRALLALSQYEGFDLPVLEAVRAKCPVIMSSIAVHHELYHSSACFVKNEGEFHAALYRALHGKILVPKTRGLYTWHKAAERCLFLFFRVLANKNRN